MLTKDSLEQLLQDWLARDWLRHLDKALVDFLATEHPETHPLVLLAAALTSHQLGRGHICLDLEYCVTHPEDALSLPPEGDHNHTAAELPSQQLHNLNLTDWLAELQKSPLVQTPNSPLALQNHKLYLRRYWQYEQNSAAAIQQRLGSDETAPESLAAHLEKLFGKPVSNQFNWQKIACALAARSAFAVITGGPGTGKTWTVVRLLALLQSTAAQKLRILMAAPTGKAAARLTESIRQALPGLPEAYRADIPLQATTLHRLLGSRPGSRLFHHHARNPLHADLIIIDEASMIDLEMMACLLDALKPQTRLILLGDKDQLASVEAGSVLGDICKTAVPGSYSPQTVAWLTKATSEPLPLASDNRPANPLAEQIAMLQVSRRFHEHSGIGRLAAAVNAGDQQSVNLVWENPNFSDVLRIRLNDAEDRKLDNLSIEGGREFFNTPQAVHGYRHYLTLMQETRPATQASFEAFKDWAGQVLRAFDEFRVLTALRQGSWGVTGLNQRLAKSLFERGLIQAHHEWYEGRPIIITQNDYSLGLMNGDIGIALQFPEPAGKRTYGSTGLRVVFPHPAGIKTVLPSRLSHYETAYAMTVHKSQGSEFNHVALILPDRPSPILTRELVYTGITRAKSWFSLLGVDPGLLDKAIHNPVRRSGGLAELLQMDGT